jgi:hypothetical protein
MHTAKSLCAAGWISTDLLTRAYDLHTAGVGIQDARWRPILFELRVAGHAMFSASVKLYGTATALFAAADSNGDFTCARGPKFVQNQQEIAEGLARLNSPQSN